MNETNSQMLAFKTNLKGVLNNTSAYTVTTLRKGFEINLKTENNFPSFSCSKSISETGTFNFHVPRASHQLGENQFWV